MEVEGPVLSVGVGAHLEVRDNVCGKETGQNLKVSTVFKYCMHLYIHTQCSRMYNMYVHPSTVFKYLANSTLYFIGIQLLNQGTR